MDKVIIVDDEIWVAEVIKNIVDWSDYGFEIVGICTDSQEAIELIKKVHPSIVFTDIRMPGKTGLELLYEIPQESPQTLCAVISGFSDFEYAKTALTYGAIGYLLKPISKEELVEVLIKARKTIDTTKNRRQEKEEIQKDYMKTVDELRIHFFKRIFEEPEFQIGGLEQINTKLKLKFKRGMFKLVCISGCGKDEMKTETIDEEIWESQLPVICNDMITFLYKDCYYLLLNYHESSEKTVDERLQKIAENYFILYKHSVFYCSESFIKIEDIRKKIGNLWKMSGLRLFFGYGNLFKEEDYKFNDSNGESLIRSTLEITLTKCINNGAKDKIRNIISNLVDELTNRVGQNGIAMYEAIEAMLKLMYNVQESIGIKKKMTVDEMGDIVSKSESLNEVKEALIKINIDFMKKKINEEDKKTGSAVEEVVEYINNYYMNNISLQDVAELVQLNQSYLSNIFKKENGISFKEYLTEVRIKKAKHFLKTTNYKLNDISKMVGYNDTKNFLKMFKKYVGVTPLDYRKLVG